MKVYQYLHIQNFKNRQLTELALYSKASRPEGFPAVISVGIVPGELAKLFLDQWTVL